MADAVEVRGADSLDARCERWRKRSIFSSVATEKGKQRDDASSSSDESDDDPNRGTVSESPPTPPPLPPLPPPATSPSSIGINGTCPCLPDPDALGQVRRHFDSRWMALFSPCFFGPFMSVTPYSRLSTLLLLLLLLLLVISPLTSPPDTARGMRTRLARDGSRNLGRREERVLGSGHVHRRHQLHPPRVLRLVRHVVRRAEDCKKIKNAWVPCCPRELRATNPSINQ